MTHNFKCVKIVYVMLTLMYLFSADCECFSVFLGGMYLYFVPTMLTICFQAG